MAQQLINIGSAPNDGSGDPARTAFDKCNLNFTELYDRSSSVSGFAEYRWDTATTPPPGSGYIRANNASVAAATALYVHNITYNGSDIKRVLTEMLVGSALVIQDQDNNVNFAKFNVTATPIDQTTYVEFPVACVNSGGVFFNNSKTLVAMVSSGGGAGGGGNVSNSGTPTNGQLAQWTDATHIQGIDATSLGYAPLASPTFTGDPKAPTATAGDNDTSIATTAFVTAAVAAMGGGGNVSNSGTPAAGQLGEWVTSTTIKGIEGRGRLVQITRQDVGSAVANVDFTSGIDATYDEYELHFFGVKVSVNAVLALQISQDAGATWKTTTGDYLWEAVYLNWTSTNSAFMGAGASGDAFITITTSHIATASNANAVAQGKVLFALPSSTASLKQFQFDSRSFQPTQAGTSWRGGGQYAGAGVGGAFNGLRIRLGVAGNITAGTFILYGVKK